MIRGRVLTPLWIRAGLLLLLGTGAAGGAVAADEQIYQSTNEFIAAAFDQAPPPARALWIEPTLRDQLTRDFGWHPGLRVRYWQEGERTAWILDEIGKEKPITAGVIVRDGSIEQIEVLVFRESRGWEIKYPFFTDQFVHAALSSGGDLNHPIDGITGATLSVSAMKRMARVALRLHDETQQTTLARRP